MNELLYNDEEYLTERALHLHLELPTDVFETRSERAFAPNVSSPRTCSWWFESSTDVFELLNERAIAPNVPSPRTLQLVFEPFN